MTTKFRPAAESLECRAMASADPLYIDPYLGPAPAPSPVRVVSVVTGLWLEVVGAPYVKIPETGTVISGSP